jgi:hypothetical protein
MWRRVALVRTDVSDERIASITMMERISKLGATLTASSNWTTLRGNTFNVFRLLVTANVVPTSLILYTLMMEAIVSSGTSVLTRDTRHNLQEDSIHHIYRRENRKSKFISYFYFNIIYIYLSKHLKIYQSVSITQILYSTSYTEFNNVFRLNSHQQV